MPAQLEHLAHAYFHQDFDIEFDSPDAVVVAFAEDEGRGAVSELTFEFDALLAGPLNEGQLEDLWIKKLGASYAPTADGQTYRDWFAHMRDLLA
jgi:hypothetical protein